MADELTTAQALGRFHAELLAEGIDAETATDLTRTVALELVSTHGLSVKKEVGRDG